QTCALPIFEGGDDDGGRERRLAPPPHVLHAVRGYRRPCVTSSAVAITVVEATEVTADLVEAVGRLLPHLSRSAPPPTESEVREMVDAPGTVLFVARDDAGSIVGTLTLVLFRIPTGI